MLVSALSRQELRTSLSIKRNGRDNHSATPRNILTFRQTTVASAPDRAPSLPYPTKANVETGLTECLSSAVEVDNQTHPLYTQLVVQGSDTPGLLRVLCWVLNGMSVRVQHGLLETTPEGLARDVLWVTDIRGKKLKDSSAESLKSRLEDFLIMCGTEVAVTRNEWRCGGIEVSNNVSPELTQVIVRGEPAAHKPGFLLELATALTSVGASIVSGAIQGGPDAPLGESAVAEPHYDFRQGRFFKFMLRGPAGGQMDADRVASLLFILRLLEGRAVMPTVAPNMDTLLREAAYDVCKFSS